MKKISFIVNIILIFGILGTCIERISNKKDIEKFNYDIVEIKMQDVF